MHATVEPELSHADDEPVTSEYSPPPAGPAVARADVALTWWGWAAVLAVTAFGGVLRFWRLDRPHSLVFDETYYVKEGWSLFKAGHELAWKGEGKVVDPKWNAGNVDVFLKTPEFVVHPPAAKWMIGAGEWIFGPTSSWGWRFSAALVGTLSILMITLIARRLFGSLLLGLVAGLLLSVDGVAFVLSRTSLLDVFVMFWALAAFGCLLIDRDLARQRLTDRIAVGPERRAGTAGTGRAGRLMSLGPGLGVRGWRLTSAVCLGLCAGSKWSGIFFAVAFGLMSLCWDLSARRSAGIRHWFVAGLLRDGLIGGPAMAATALTVYVGTWSGYLFGSGGYERDWAAAHPSAHFGWVPDGLRSLWKYHQGMWWSNTHITSAHPYESNPWSWLILGRPTAFSYVYLKKGQSGCAVADCVQAITPIGNPVIWWGAVLALPVLLFSWVLRRDWRAGAVLAGLAAGYLPWFLYQYRTIFAFYSVAFVPFMVLALTYVLGLLLGPSHPSVPPGRGRLITVGAVVLIAVLVFWFFLPIYTSQTIPWASWGHRTWLKGWT